MARALPLFLIEMQVAEGPHPENNQWAKQPGFQLDKAAHPEIQVGGAAACSHKKAASRPCFTQNGQRQTALLTTLPQAHVPLFQRQWPKAWIVSSTLRQVTGETHRHFPR